VLERPVGTITLLFTDIEGSTGLWERHPGTMPAAMGRHDAILGEAIETRGGFVFRTVGDAFFAAFAGAHAALDAALAAQRALAAEPWPMLEEQPGAPNARITVRMSLHTSAVELRDGDYFGPPLNRVSRLLSAGYGGQTLVCGDTADLVRDSLPADVTLRDLGRHRLKDLRQAMQIFQLDATGLRGDFPPLKTLTVAAARAPSASTFHQAKLPGMPGVDYDALWKREKEREQQRRSKKRKKPEDSGLF
jgi:class 3 adenylate cyclase